MSGLSRFPSEDRRQVSSSNWNVRNRSLRLTSPVKRILTGLLVTLIVVFIAVLGYVSKGWSWNDSFYMVIITIFGVGYGEIQPIDTPFLRWLTIGLIICGYVAAIYTVGGFGQLLIDGELRRILGVRRMQKEIDQLEDHVVICGFGRMGSKLAESLANRGRALVVVDSHLERVEEARSHGCLAIQGNATEEETLRSAGVEKAAILTTVLSDDVANLFITITAHDLNPELEILARAEKPSSIKKLRQVGATNVILPATIGADRLANLILRPGAEQLLNHAELPAGLNQDLSSLGLRLDELEIQNGSSLIGGQMQDLLSRSANSFLIVASRAADGQVVINPPPEHPLALGDSVVLLAHDEDIEQLCRRYSLHSEIDEDQASIPTST